MVGQSRILFSLNPPGAHHEMGLRSDLYGPDSGGQLIVSTSANAFVPACLHPIPEKNLTFCVIVVSSSVTNTERENDEG